MKFKVFGRMQSCPSIKLDTEISPLDFGACINGHFHGELGPVHARIGEIPFRLAIPFLRRRPVLMGSIGGFPIKLDRFQINVEKAGLDVSGTLGLNGIQASAEAVVDCETDVQLQGTIMGKVGLSHLDLGEEEFPAHHDHEHEHY
jgi:hypothetical protein